MKCSLGISNFLEEISSLPHSVVFLYFFALIAEEGFLISPCCCLELCFQMLLSFRFSFSFHFFFLTAICKASADSHFAFLHFFSIYTLQFSSVSSVVSDSLRPHESQHTRPPCPSPSPGVHSDSCHRVCDAIQPFHPWSSPSPPAPNPSQHQSLFQ